MKGGSQAVPHARWPRVSRLQTWRKEAASKKWQEKVGTNLAKTGDPGLIPPTAQGGTSWLCPMRQSACSYHQFTLTYFLFIPSSLNGSGTSQMQELSLKSRQSAMGINKTERPTSNLLSPFSWGQPHPLQRTHSFFSQNSVSWARETFQLPDSRPTPEPCIGITVKNNTDGKLRHFLYNT